MQRDLPAQWSPRTNDFQIEASGLSYLLWSSLRQLFRLYRDDERFPGTDHYFEAAFFRKLVVKRVFHITEQYGPYVLGTIIDQLIIEYCQMIRAEWNASNNPSPQLLYHLVDNEPLSDDQVQRLRDFMVDETRDTPLDEMHHAALRLSRVRNFHNRITRDMFSMPPRGTSNSFDELARDMYDLPAANITPSNIMDSDDEEMTDSSSSADSWEASPTYRSSSVVVKAMSSVPTIPEFMTVHNDRMSIDNPAFNNGLPIDVARSNQSRKTLPISAGGISVAMDEFPIGETRPIEVNDTTQNSNEIVPPTTKNDHDQVIAVTDRSATSYDESSLHEYYQISAYDYTECPFPENRKHEVAQSRLISSDLRTPGFISKGLQIQDLVNLPPIHCRSQKDLPSIYKKRTPYGSYELVKYLGKAALQTLRIMKRDPAPITRPLMPPSIKSRLSCNHHKHKKAQSCAGVSKARDPGRAIARPFSGLSNSCVSADLRGGGGGGSRQIVNTSDSDDEDENKNEDEDEDEERPEGLAGENEPAFFIYEDSSQRGQPQHDPQNNAAAVTTSLGQENHDPDQPQPRRQVLGNLPIPISPGNVLGRGDPVQRTSSLLQDVQRGPATIPCHPCPYYHGQFHHHCIGEYCYGLVERQADLDMLDVVAGLAHLAQFPA